MSPQAPEAQPPAPTASAGGVMARLAARPATILALALAAQGLFLAWRRRFVQDDAFISFGYARALVEGHGLTWFGDRVEGYTNFLWVLWIALGTRCGADPIVWSQAGGLVAYAALLWAVWRLGLELCGAPLPALVALAIVVTNASVTAFATGGLETMLQTALLAHAALQLLRLRRAAAAPAASHPPAGEGHAIEWTRRARTLSLLLAAAVLTRLDSLLFATLFGGVALQSLRVGGRSRSDTRRAVVALAVPFAVVVGTWTAWRLAYYGDLLPNTYHAKVSWDVATLRAGALYLWRFLDAYLLWPFALAAAVAWAMRRPPLTRATGTIWATLGLATALWSAYLAAVGGDFMEFRMLVPIVPFVALLVAFPACTALPRSGAAAGAMVALLLALASAQHARRFDGVTPDHRLDSVPALANFYALYPDGDWGSLGRELRTQVGGAEPVLGLHAIGAIPYASRLRTVDMFGLTDRDIALHGNPAPSDYRRPGHQRQASLAQLRQRGVQLVIGHPTLIGRGQLTDPRFTANDAQWVRNILSSERAPIGRATLVAMPLQHRPEALLMWYLTPTPGLDAIIHERGWETTTVDVGR